MDCETKNNILIIILSILVIFTLLLWFNYTCELFPASDSRSRKMRGDEKRDRGERRSRGEARSGEPPISSPRDARGERERRLERRQDQARMFGHHYQYSPMMTNVPILPFSAYGTPIAGQPIPYPIEVGKLVDPDHPSLETNMLLLGRCLTPLSAPQNQCWTYEYKAQYISPGGQVQLYDVGTNDKLQNGDVIHVTGIGRRRVILSSDYMTIMV